MSDPNKNLNNLTNMSDETNQFDPADIEKNKTMGILSYFGFLVLAPIFSAKDSPYAKFHANQGLALFICELIIFVLMLFTGIPVIGFILSIVGGILSLCVGVLAILGIINAVQGKAKKLPIIGGIKILK